MRTAGPVVAEADGEGEADIGVDGSADADALPDGDAAVDGWSDELELQPASRTVSVTAGTRAEVR